MKRKENKGQSRWKNDHFFHSFIWNYKKCFYFAERKMERKLKMDVKSNLDGDYIVKISSSKKGQYKPK